MRIATSPRLTTLFFAVACAQLGVASCISRRAGGPAIVPIPANCSVTNPLLASPSASYAPGPSTDGALFYNVYYPSYTTNSSAMAEQCLQQCYGYGDHVECKAAFWAENLVVPAGYYETPGGQLSTGCLFFNRTLVSSDFVLAPEGQAINAFAGNIAC
ncbi:hypothetical protein EK21DRAFT_54847 [Setomelanomma holmii]|uniref:Apple domain-containing protein n=1 Tax=Setomelanomma holmii TaxID=210430 RepID=A0A9P4HK87_9PLEO|nr:hypothetical protein EK21DRAFT_54847 [Setomelanomma holmii]